jgi:hypothetical protein
MVARVNWPGLGRRAHPTTQKKTAGLAPRRLVAFWPMSLLADVSLLAWQS